MRPSLPNLPALSGIRIEPIQDVLGVEIRKTFVSLQDQSGMLRGVQETIRSFSELRTNDWATQYRASGVGWQNQLQDIRKTIAALARPSESVFDQFRRRADEVFEHLVAPTRRHLKFLAEVREGQDALDSTGFGYLKHSVSPRWLASVGPADSRSRAAMLTNRLQQVTCSTDFKASLFVAFGQFQELRPWLKALSETLDAHRRRHYHTSIPALLVIVEGVVDE